MTRLGYALGSLTVAAAMLAGTGCAEHRYRVYDPYYHDYHRWTPEEDRVYHDWYVKTYPRRDYRDFKHLEPGEQQRYWQYRHGS